MRHELASCTRAFDDDGPVRSAALSWGDLAAGGGTEMSLTDCLVEVAWGDLADDGAPPREFGEALRRRSAVLVRDCPAQLATPPPLLYELAEQLFGLPEDVLCSHAVDDLKNEGGFIPPGRWRGTVLPEVWHIVSEAKPPIRK